MTARRARVDRVLRHRRTIQMHLQQTEMKTIHQAITTAHHILRCAALAVLSVSAAGCADDGLVPINGSVQVDGEPLELGTITFKPVDGNGPTAEAVIQAGVYTVSIAPGLKTVEVRSHKKVGEQFPWGKDNPPAPIYEDVVPARYNTKSKLQCEIDAVNVQHDFELDTS